jgi:DNA mismatch endonuclease (patch repair protein)
LPGRPDIIFSKQRLAIFVDGCFWHGCSEHYQLPETNSEFWNNKIKKNVERDKRNDFILRDMGWNIIRIWEHELKNNLDGCLKNIKKYLFHKNNTN